MMPPPLFSFPRFLFIEDVLAGWTWHGIARRFFDIAGDEKLERVIPKGRNHRWGVSGSFGDGCGALDFGAGIFHEFGLHLNFVGDELMQGVELRPLNR